VQHKHNLFKALEISNYIVRVARDGIAEVSSKGEYMYIKAASVTSSDNSLAYYLFLEGAIHCLFADCSSECHLYSKRK